MRYLTIVTVMLTFLLTAINAHSENMCPLGDVVINNKTYDCLTYNAEKDRWEGHNGKKTDLFNPDDVSVYNEDGKYYRKWTTDNNGRKIARVVLEENSPYWIISRYNFDKTINVNNITFDNKKMEWIAYIENAKGETIEQHFSVNAFEAFDENGSMDRLVTDYLVKKIDHRS